MRDNYSILVINNLLRVLKNEKYFSILDSNDEFYHNHISEEFIKYIAFILRYLNIIQSYSNFEIFNKFSTYKI